MRPADRGDDTKQEQQQKEVAAVEGFAQEYLVADKEKQRHQQRDEPADLVGDTAFEVFVDIAEAESAAQPEDKRDHLNVKQHAEQGEAVA